MEYLIRTYKKGEEHYVADAHRRVYSEEYNWGDSFISYAAKVAADFASKKPSSREGLWVAEDFISSKLVGCIMLCETDEKDVGQLRLFLVEKAYRRYGIGSALTKELLDHAKQAGYKKLILWTASPLTEAIDHYKRLGFIITESVDNAEWSNCKETLQEIKMEMIL